MSEPPSAFSRITTGPLSIRHRQVGWAWLPIVPLFAGPGLWNQRHVDEAYDLEFLSVFESMIGS